MYNNKRHRMRPVSRRIRRSLKYDKLLLDDLMKQLDIDERWLWKAKKKISYQNDALDYPNKREENSDPDQHEMLSNTTEDLKYPDETTIIAEVENSQALIEIDTTKSISDVVKDETESNSSHYVTIEGQEEVLKGEFPFWKIILENQTKDVEDILDKPLEPVEEIPLEEWKDFEETEDEENSQFEIISENEQIKAKPRIPRKRRMPKLLGKMSKTYKYASPIKMDLIKNKTMTKTRMRSRRSAKKGGVNRGIFNAKMPKFTRYEKLDEDGDVILEWDPSDEEEVTFRVTAKILGYVGIGFNEKGHMMGADILLAWVDDHTGVVNLLVSQSPTRPILISRWSLIDSKATG